MGCSSHSFDSALSKWRTKHCRCGVELLKQIACAHVSGICISIACFILILDWMLESGCARACVCVCVQTSKTRLVVVDPCR